jgi:hypothetical protein
VTNPILPSSTPQLSNNIIKKGLAFIGDWSGTVVRPGPHERPGILPRRLVGRSGASVVRRNAAINRIEDSDADVFKEASAQIHSGAGDDCKASTARHHRSREEERCGLQASSRHRDASIADRSDDRRDEKWSYRTGAELADELQYVPMPKDVVQLIESAWDAVKDPRGQPAWTSATSAQN